ncbi:MAG TPA: hypothetical protein VGP81_00565 [Pyrinomonadaceae bacterium]|jgi:hypothetical protein|nr:hypothetical protein [Pyrinomonadaceae bacterium]
MFCPSCGTESIGLNYCNRCGANLTAPAAAPVVQLAPISLTKPILIISVLVGMITLGGFAGIVSGTIQMVERGAGNVSPALPIFGLPCILVIDILLIRQLSKLISAALSPNQAEAPPSLPAQTDLRYLPPTTTARLEGKPSVTENTTRFFEDPYRPPAEPQSRNR